VAPQHLPELNRQIEVLERAGIIRRSTSLYGASLASNFVMNVSLACTLQ